jgi:catalase
VNYEPNSWQVGPRVKPEKAFKTFPAEEDGAKQRVRSETFADHYSQARQFYISQTPIEQRHIADALVFELSKVEMVAIRTRMVSHLLNIDKDLAVKVAQGLGLAEMPKPAEAAMATRDDLEPSPALSILKNGPESFAGRSVGILLTDGFDLDQLQALLKAIKAEGATAKLIAPQVGRVKASNGNYFKADEKIDGGPSVLFDAVALLVTEDGAKQLANDIAARDFVSDAIAHRKFIAHTSASASLLELTPGLNAKESQLVALNQSEGIDEFITRCRKLRVWDAEELQSKPANVGD